MPIGFEWKKIFTVLITGFYILYSRNTDRIEHKVLIAIIRIIIAVIISISSFTNLNLFEAIEIQRTKEGIVKLQGRIIVF